MTRGIFKSAGRCSRGLGRRHHSGGALVEERGDVVGVVSARLKEARTAERKFEDVVKAAEQAAVLVLVY